MALTFPLGTTTIWIHVGLNEPNVTLYNRANVLYPLPRTLLVFFDGATLKSERDQIQLSRPPRTKAPIGTYDAIYSPIIAFWCSLAAYFLAYIASLRHLLIQTGAGARTSVSAFTTRDRGPLKSPYLTVNLASTPPSGNLCTTSGWVSADATRRTKSFGPFFWTLHEVRRRSDRIAGETTGNVRTEC